MGKFGMATGQNKLFTVVALTLTTTLKSCNPETLPCNLTNDMEHNGIWSESFRINAFMVDKNREAGFTTIANLFQEVANNHAFNRQLDFYNMRERGLFWVLGRLRLTLLRRPLWQETVFANTWVSRMAPFAHRHLEMLDAAGLPLAYAYSIWSPLDAITRKPRRLPDVEVPLSDKTTPLRAPDKIVMAENGAVSFEKKVTYSDLDMLGHVNNVKYIEWMLDDLYQQTEKIPYNTLEINYIDEVFQGQTVQLHTTKTTEAAFFLLRCAESGQEVCRARWA